MSAHSSQHISAQSDRQCTRQFRECTGLESDSLQAQDAVVSELFADKEDALFNRDFPGYPVAYWKWREASVVLNNMKDSIQADCWIPCQRCVVSFMISIFTSMMLTPQSKADTTRFFEQPPSLNDLYTLQLEGGSGDGDQAQPQLLDGSVNTAQR
jgi:hypothetical protein